MKENDSTMKDDGKTEREQESRSKKGCFCLVLLQLTGVVHCMCVCVFVFFSSLASSFSVDTVCVNEMFHQQFYIPHVCRCLTMAFSISVVFIVGTVKRTPIVPNVDPSFVAKRVEWRWDSSIFLSIRCGQNFDCSFAYFVFVTLFLIHANNRIINLFIHIYQRKYFLHFLFYDAPLYRFFLVSSLQNPTLSYLRHSPLSISPHSTPASIQWFFCWKCTRLINHIIE